MREFLHGLIDNLCSQDKAQWTTLYSYSLDEFIIQKTLELRN